MSSRKKKNKRDKKKRGRPFKPGFSHPAIPGSMLVVSPPGEQKMSEVLLKFVEPYSDEWETPEELRKLLALATLVWNAALLPESERDNALQSMLDAVGSEDHSSLRNVFQEMMRRKLALFDSNKRAVLDYQVTMTPDGPHVSVVSTLTPHK